MDGGRGTRRGLQEATLVKSACILAYIDLDLVRASLTPPSKVKSDDCVPDVDHR